MTLYSERKRLIEQYQEWRDKSAENGTRIPDCHMNMLAYLASIGCLAKEGEIAKLTKDLAEMTAMKNELYKTVLSCIENTRINMTSLVNDNERLQEELRIAKLPDDYEPLMHFKEW